MLINVNFLAYQEQLTIKRKAGKAYIYDPVRKKDLFLQPEELVRQLIIQYLLESKGYPLNKIAVEYGLKVNDLAKRCDILVYNADYQPILMVECKAPTVKLTQAVFKQIAIYNMSLRVPYLVVSNGPDTYCAKIDFENENFYFLDEIPSFESMVS